MQEHSGYCHLDVPGFDIYFVLNRYGDIHANKKTHTHPYYELIFYMDKNGEWHFVINPPLYEHTTIDKAQSTSASIFFLPKEGCSDEIATEFKSIRVTVEGEDDFGGLQHICSIKPVAEFVNFGVKEQTIAEVRLLMVKVARKLAGEKIIEMPKRTLHEERLTRLDWFFNSKFRSPDCSKAELANELGVSERQLTRILKGVYGKNFHELLVEARMNAARALFNEGYGIEDVMAETGYVSRRTFERAYRDFFGAPIVKRNGEERT